MKKIALILIALVASQCAMAQQFSLPIMPEKMWPSDYAKYESDVLNCCNWLIHTNPEFNAPKHEECSSFLVRWLAGTPAVKIVIADGLVDAGKSDLLIVYMAAWTRHQLQHPEANAILCANVAEEVMLDFYTQYKSQVGKSKLTEKLLKQQAKGTLPAYINQQLGVKE